MSGKDSTVKGVFSLVAGTALLIATLVLVVRTREFVRTARAAEGTVVSLNAGGSHPQIEFIDNSGARISYAQGGLIFGYRPGERVRVLYRPGDAKSSACIDVFGALFAFPLILGAIGACFLAGGLALVSGLCPWLS